MRRLLLIAGLIGALSVPAISLAAVPPAVNGIRAERTAEGVLVSWTPIADPAVTKYRVYQSQKSILKNDGYYDDFETTEGLQSSYILKVQPDQPVFVAVMALNAEGQESQFFVEEVFVDRAPAATPAPEPAPVSSTSSVASSVSSASSTAAVPPPRLEEGTPPPTEAAVTLQLLSVDAVTATGVVLHFSEEIRIDPNDAPAAFLIVDQSGSTLVIQQLAITGKDVLVTTEMQTSGKVYEVRLSEPLMGKGDLALDTMARTALFTGHESGLEPEAAGPTVPTDTTLPDVLGLELTGQKEKGRKTYTVTAKWTPVTDSTVSFSVRQSRDGGKTFSPPDLLPGTVSGVKFEKVVQGEFGIVVNTIAPGKESSPGVFRSITLGTGAPVAADLLTQGKPLTDSGPEIAGIAALLFGSFAGWRRGKKK